MEKLPGQVESEGVNPSSGGDKIILLPLYDLVNREV